MRLLICLLCVISLGATGCGSGDDGGDRPSTPPPNTDTPDNTVADSGFAQAMLSAHNDLRASATPVPNPALPPLTWSTEAAKKAQAWAEHCTLQSNPDHGGSYNYDKNACAPGKVCSDYTQIVWRDTTQVGCAVKLCDENSPFGSTSQWEVWVCYYSPPGNQAEQRPY
jgi:pathogenesis-related protein 1